MIGIGDVVLKGADNPRATGDGARTLVLSTQKGRVSYGSDAEKISKELGDPKHKGEKVRSALYIKDPKPLTLE